MLNSCCATMLIRVPSCCLSSCKTHYTRWIHAMPLCWSGCPDFVLMRGITLYKHRIDTVLLCWSFCLNARRMQYKPWIHIAPICICICMYVCIYIYIYIHIQHIGTLTRLLIVTPFLRTGSPDWFRTRLLRPGRISGLVPDCSPLGSSGLVPD